MGKRAFDLFFSVLGLLACSPLLLIIAVTVKLSDGGPVFFRQQRIGQGGRRFWLLKFRSMVLKAEALGLAITADGDRRITPVGRFLRKHKMDELPQLWNVLRGEMSFVGPRPEVPRYVEKYTAEQKRVLALKPGITDLATLEFRDEEELLRRYAGNAADEVEAFYVRYCVPRKIELNLAYAKAANVWTDLLIILRTLFPLWDARRKKELKAEQGDQHEARRGARTATSRS